MSATQMLKDWLNQNYQYRSYTLFFWWIFILTPLQPFFFCLLSLEKSWRLSLLLKFRRGKLVTHWHAE